MSQLPHKCAIPRAHPQLDGDTAYDIEMLLFTHGTGEYWACSAHCRVQSCQSIREWLHGLPATQAASQVSIASGRLGVLYSHGAMAWHDIKLFAARAIEHKSAVCMPLHQTWSCTARGAASTPQPLCLCVKGVIGPELHPLHSAPGAFWHGLLINVSHSGQYKWKKWVFVLSCSGMGGYLDSAAKLAPEHQRQGLPNEAAYMNAKEHTHTHTQAHITH
eukprot:1144969-Pelagomonas_calceolata.AAC.1